MLTIRDYREIPEWDEFVRRHPKGSALHTGAMIRSHEATKKHIPYAIGALDSTGKLCALLVAVRVTTGAHAASTMATRSIQFAEPIYLEEANGHLGVRLLIAQHDAYMASRALFAEVRPLFDVSAGQDPLVDCGYQKLGYVNYELPLCSCEDELFRRLGGKRRNNVRSAQRKGVEVREQNTPQGIAEFYALVCASYARSKLPVVDCSLFEAASKEFLAQHWRIYTAYFEGRAVSSGCFLAFKNRVICWYAGTLRIPGVPAMSCLFWHAMRTFAAEGYEVFDLAGGGWEGESYGPGQFKSKFGGQQTNFGRYRKVYSPWKMKVANAIYQRVRDFLAPGEELARASK
ncbi:MAG: GNAT family N-acetyltransferase [Pirellulaceae bacterium]|nr:GNAT family N-acetyltransferase [Pirellulaceae bacterium]